jgi:hypothetical protein
MMRQRLVTVIGSVALVATAACGSLPSTKDPAMPSPTAQPMPPPPQAAASPLDRTAERYVRLVLAMGQHDADFVDAFYGPAEWRTAAENERLDLGAIRAQTQALLRELAAIDSGSRPEIERLRHAYQRRQLEALVGRLDALAGSKLSFDEESRTLYDAVSPAVNLAELDDVLTGVEALLPGAGTLPERYDRFRQQTVIPPERVDRVFRAAIDECRRRTALHVELPEGESFTLEYVTDKSWGGYNWYQGGYKSLIQVNTDLPIYIDRALDLACHEGYPGHHVYNLLLEKHLVNERGWVEFTVYPLFSPQSLIAEGTANFGIEVAFPADEKLRFERDVLYPLAGLDPALAEHLGQLLRAMEKLSYAGNHAARRYLDGEIDRQQAADWLVRYTLTDPARAAQRVRFFAQYRSYVINYNLGKDLVRRHVEALGGTEQEPEKRWRLFLELLSSPRLPSGLAGAQAAGSAPGHCG